MNKIKDFFYDKNDILLALLIIAGATLLILWRVDAIVDYPRDLVAATYVSEKPNSPITTPYENNSLLDDENPSGADAGSELDGSGDSSLAENGNTGSDRNTSSGNTPEMFAIYINFGETTQQIGETMVSLGFFESTDEFIQMVNALGAETKLQTGNHIIPENATKDEVIAYLMEPGL